MLKSETRVTSAPLVASQQQGRRWRRDWPLNLVLGVLAFLTYVPLVIVLVDSFKDTRQFFTEFWLPSLPLHPENYLKALPVIAQSLLYTVIYTAPTTLL